MPQGPGKGPLMFNQWPGGEIQQEQMQSPAPERNNLLQQYGWGLPGWGTALQKRPCKCWWTMSWTRTKSVPWQQRSPAASWVVITGVEPEDQEKWLFYLVLKYCIQFCAQYKKEIDKLDQLQWRDTKMIRTGTLAQGEETEAMGLVQPRQERASGGLKVSWKGLHGDKT